MLGKALLRIGLLSLGRQLILQIVQLMSEVTLSRVLHCLILLVKFAGIRLGLTFDSLHLAAELLFFEGHPLSFEFDLLELLAVFSAEGCVLLLAFLELKSLVLVFLIDGHQAFEVSLNFAKFGCKLSLTLFGGLIFILGHFDFELVVLIRLNEKTQLLFECPQFISLPELQLVGQILVELVFALK